MSKTKTSPLRIQRRRVKGWRMPANTRYVGRGSKFGNPYRVGADESGPCAVDAHDAVQRYADDLYLVGLVFSQPDIAALRGQNLACWCRLCQRHQDGKPLGEHCPDCEPCHADVLGEVANQEISR